MSSPPRSSQAESDTDRTAELPALQPAPNPGSEHHQSATDTWLAPPLPKDERLRQLEHTRDEALEARAAAERRAAQLDRELAELHAEHAFQLDEHARARAHFEEQLAQARALLSAASARSDELQGRLSELEGAARVQRDTHAEHRQQVVRDRARAAGAMGDLRQERERAIGLLESLQSAESRRAILEELVTDMQREGEERERELARVARALVGRDAHARELDAELAQRASRIARLEQQVRSLAAARSSSDSRQQGELERLQAERAEFAAAVESTRSAALATTTQAPGHETALAEMRARRAELESALTAERRRVGQLEDEQANARREMQDWAGALQTTQQERNAQAGRLAAAEARVRELEEWAAEQKEAMCTLRSESAAGIARARELESDLHAAEEAVHRLESEARGRNARLEELERASIRWRTLEESRHAHAESAASEGPREAQRPPPEAQRPPPEVRRPPSEADSSAGAPEAVPDGATRLLISSENGREVVHVLGRRTSIGRTPDNDLQIEVRSISRHHAVILAGPVHTIVEDLNSTNGVLVNGRRVTRQILKDGDTVQIARLQYRFVVRRGGEKR